MTIQNPDNVTSEPLIGKKPEAGEQQHLPLDSGLLSQVISELNIARKNFVIYPLGHIQITISTDKAYGLLARLMNSRAGLIIGVGKDRIFTDNSQLDFRNPVHREFSLALHSLNIAAVSFLSGLRKEEVFDFLKIMARGIEDREGRSDIVMTMNEAGIEHIRIETIDYDLFYLTEETEIVPSESLIKHKSIDIWHEFIGNLFSEQSFDKSRRNRLVRMKPSEFAAEINDRNIDPAIVLRNFKKIFAEPFLPQNQYQFDMRLDTLLKNLQPELRKQFLTITFDAISVGSGNVIENFSNDMVIEMLHHANSQNKQLSPSLINLLEKLSHIQGSMPLDSEKMGTAGFDADSPLSKEYLQKLLDRESYEKYVDDNYNSMLQQLSKETIHSGKFPREVSSELVLQETHPSLKTLGSTVSESFMDVFDAEFLDLRITHISLALLDQNLAIEDYAGFAENLVLRAGHFIDTGVYDVVLMMIQTFQRHIQEKSDSFRLVAEECLQRLMISDIPTRALQVLQDGSSDQFGVASDILSAVGKSAIPGIMDLYIADASPVGGRAVFELLKTFGMDSLEEAYVRLHDSRIAVLRKMLAFIRKLGSKASIRHIRPFVSHDDPIVRLDALTALLHFQDPEVAAFLCRSLQSSDHRECLGAIQLSGYYRIAEVTNVLSGMLIKSPWRKVDYRKNATIIKSLGKIGDPCVLPVLEKLSEKSLAIYPDELRKMKIAVFESLSGYPRENLSQFVIIGEQSDDYRIRDICKDLS
jgi:hypothetical protein